VWQVPVRVSSGANEVRCVLIQLLHWQCCFGAALVSQLCQVYSCDMSLHESRQAPACVAVCIYAVTLADAGCTCSTRLVQLKDFNVHVRAFRHALLFMKLRSSLQVITAAAAAGSGCRYHVTDKVPRPGHPDWKRVVAVIVQVGL
jgi:hypothetical protein